MFVGRGELRQVRVTSLAQGRRYEGCCGSQMVMDFSSCLRGCCVCGSSAMDRCRLASCSGGGTSELLALLAEALLGSSWAHQMTRAPLVSVEVVERGMGAGGVVRSVSDKMDTASTVAGLGDVQGRPGIQDVSTPGTIVGEPAELLVLWHIGRHWRPSKGEPCMRG